MELVISIFPLSFLGRTLKNLIISILIYIGIYVVCSLVLGLLFFIPLLGWLRSIVGWVVNIYCTVGIVIAILNFLKVFKN